MKTSLLIIAVLIVSTFSLNLKVQSKSEENLLQNTDFATEIFPEGELYGFFNKVQKWKVEKDEIEIGYLKFYKRNIPVELEEVKGIEIDGKDNDSISQSFTLSATDNKNLLVGVSYFATDFKKNTSGIEILFNKVKILKVNPSEDYKIYDFSIEIKGVTGLNEIEFIAQGESDGYGLVFFNPYIVQKAEIEETC